MSLQLSMGVFTTPHADVPRALDALGLQHGRDLVHHFEPQGVSWVRLNGKGRAAIHTWPERGLVSVDVWAPERIDLAAALAPLGWEAS